MKLHPILVTAEVLRGLANLRDVELESRGIDPASVTAAVLELPIGEGRDRLPRFLPSAS